MVHACIPYISRRRSIGPNSLRPLRSVDILNGSSPSCSRNSLDLHSAYHCNNGYNQQGVLFQNFPASGPLLRYHHYHVTLHPHEIQVSRTSAVRVKCSRKQGHVLRCHPPHNNLLPRLVYIILRLLFRLWIYHPPQRIIPPPHGTSFSAYHLVYSLPNGDDVCPYDNIKPPPPSTALCLFPTPHSPSS